jgi:enoyl-CoA hydratase/carnithine racemase
MADIKKNNDHIKTGTDGNILRLTLNRPEKKNALTAKMYSDMAQAIEYADKTSKIRVIFLSSSSDCFCSGNDLADFMVFSQKNGPKLSNPFLSALSHAQTPIVAAVGGPAIGIGTTMLLHCDLVYAGQNASFKLPFVNLGLCPEAGSSYLLPFTMGYQRAARLILLGESISAKEAFDFGIVSAVVADNKLISFAWQKACQLAKLPKESVRLSKSLLKKAFRDILDQTIADEIHHFAKRLQTSEFAEAVTAFFEKRKPKSKDQ